MEKKISILILFFFTSFFVYSQCTTEIQVNFVTVLPNGDVTISWQSSPDAGIVSYDVYNLNPNTSSNDSLTSTNNSTLSATIPFDTIVKYQITQLGVVANCGFGVGISPLGNNYHNTIQLSSTIDICSYSTDLSWNAYDDFNSGLDVLYKIYVSVNGGAYSMVGTTTSLNYNYSGLNQGINYQFYVQAIENSGAGPYTSSSNVITVTGDFLVDPSFLYQYTATVIDSSQIQVLFYADTSADITEYIVKRALANDEVYSTIATIPDVNGMNPLVEFNDYEVDANNFSYFYQIYSVNICGQTKLISNQGRTILLSVTTDEVGATDTLKWNLYEGWQGGVLKYDIYRKTSESIDYEYIDTYGATTDSLMIYVDNVYGLTDVSGEFCYKIIAREAFVIHTDNLPLATSTSNSVCVNYSPLVYIPNAFVPDGLTPIFKPSAILFEFESYDLQIYDRWGKPIFATNNKDEGWNGLYNNTGVALPMASYVYVLKIRSASGNEIVKRGAVTLIR